MAAVSSSSITPVSPPGVAEKMDTDLCRCAGTRIAALWKAMMDGIPVQKWESLGEDDCTFRATLDAAYHIPPVKEGGDEKRFPQVMILTLTANRVLFKGNGPSNVIGPFGSGVRSAKLPWPIGEVSVRADGHLQWIAADEDKGTYTMCNWGSIKGIGMNIEDASPFEDSIKRWTEVYTKNRVSEDQ